MFTKAEYDAMHALVFRPDYPGYRPTQIEIPNGDGKADAEKRFAHIAPKYFATDQHRADLMPFLEKAHSLAETAADVAEVPLEFMPRIEYGALRVLDYPPGAISNLHEDFDLFTLMMYRDQPDRFVAREVAPSNALHGIQTVNKQAHLGQLGQEIGLGPATPHEVLPSEERQCSIVYFAIPDWNAVLPSGLTVKDWLNSRMARSRTEFKAYE